MFCELFAVSSDDSTLFSPLCSSVCRFTSCTYSWLAYFSLNVEKD